MVGFIRYFVGFNNFFQCFTFPKSLVQLGMLGIPLGLFTSNTVRRWIENKLFIKI